MPAKVVSKENAEHYLWGGALSGGPAGTESDGWYLMQAPGVNVIEERMPPGAFETRHVHARARQFFYVLEGELTIEIEHHDFVLKPGQGIEIAPGQEHQAINRGATALRILVTSQPPSHGDRTETPLR